MMNKKLGLRTRGLLKEGLAKCTLRQKVIFARMYAPEKYRENPNDFMYNLEQLAEHNIDLVVDQMAPGALEWALLQVQRTLDKEEKS